MPLSQLPTSLSAWLSDITAALDRRSAPRLLLLLVGALFAKGRRTVTSWFHAAGITTDFRPAYNALGAAGRRVDALSYRLLGIALKPLMRRIPGDRLLFAIDDTPTVRYGPCVQGAGIHHNPSPGPPAKSSSTVTSGSASPGWPITRPGTRWPCRCVPCCTSAPRTCRRWPRTTPGRSVPSWNWLRSWSAG